MTLGRDGGARLSLDLIFELVAHACLTEKKKRVVTAVTSLRRECDQVPLVRREVAVNKSLLANQSRYSLYYMPYNQFTEIVQRVDASFPRRHLPQMYLSLILDVTKRVIFVCLPLFSSRVTVVLSLWIHYYRHV
jgi:hypothetical protein